MCTTSADGFPMVEDICAENNQNLFDYKMPVEETPDF